ncbi:MAG: FixH family protein [Paracoccaceae bacterium]
MGEITGRHVLAFTVGAFGIIIAVNVVMAWKAISTFPGLEAENTFVASQEFDARRSAQEALGWTVAVGHERGKVRLSFTDAAGNPVEVGTLDVLIGRPTAARDDLRPEFTWLGGLYEAEAPLARGEWMLKLRATAKDGTLFEQRFDLMVAG